jgi:hypothetical protein
MKGKTGNKLLGPLTLGGGGALKGNKHLLLRKSVLAGRLVLVCILGVLRARGGCGGRGGRILRHVFGEVDDWHDLRSQSVLVRSAR